MSSSEESGKVGGSFPIDKKRKGRKKNKRGGKKRRKKQCVGREKKEKGEREREDFPDVPTVGARWSEN